MRRLLSAFLRLFRNSTAASTAASAQPASATVPDHADFAARLHGQLATKKGNLFYSPLSIRMALSLAQPGAVGETATQMRDVIGWGDDPSIAIMKLRKSWQLLADPKASTRASSNDPTEQKYAEEDVESQRIILRVVNRLWGEKSHKVKEDFVATLRDRYDAPLETLDFKHAPEPSRNTINGWVGEQTQGKIPHLIPEGSIKDDTKIIITNAVYFKARWSEQFETRDTKQETFHAPRGAQQVKMMHQVNYFWIGRLGDALMLEMPYGDGSMAMDVVLPNNRTGLAAIEKRYVAGALPGWVAQLEHKKVDVALPSFKTEASLELADVLQAMGMTRAFKYPDADFSAIDGTHELFISAVIHQAFVAVDEKGTEAAAATAVMMRSGGKPIREHPIKFHADHPFLVIIRDTKSGEPMFVGRILDP